MGHKVRYVLSFRDLLLVFGPVWIHEAQRLGCPPRVTLREELPKWLEMRVLETFTVRLVMRHDEVEGVLC